MYALARNAAKYVERDKRTEKVQHLEFDYLAPDSVNELFDALDILAKRTAIAYDPNLKLAEYGMQLQKGHALLNSDEDLSTLTILAEGFENSTRPVELIKVKEGYGVFKKLVRYYGVLQLLQHIKTNQVQSFSSLVESLPQQPERTAWLNLGGQLVPERAVQRLIEGICNNTIKSWDAIHEVYSHLGAQYANQKLFHAFAALLEITGNTRASFTPPVFKELLEEAGATKAWLFENIYQSRAKDYQNPFRQMLYDTDAELEAVVGRLDDNSFIKSQQEELHHFQHQVTHVQQQFGL